MCGWLFAAARPRDRLRAGAVAYALRRQPIYFTDFVVRADMKLASSTVAI